jgi:glycosyltransferase involved in cell wall biosynthesis
MTDGGFPLQMEAISDLFTQTNIVVPCGEPGKTDGLSSLMGNGMKIVPLSVPKGKGFRRKLNLPLWLFKNILIILREVRQADAVHTPIPGDVGTFGMFFALLFRKPLFVRHCGNWFLQRTMAERFWKWAMEYFAGGRNVMLATGGAEESPSGRNPHIEWIFSTSLRNQQIMAGCPRELPQDGKLRLIIACRQEEKKGTDVVIAALSMIADAFPALSLDVVGGGSLLAKLEQQAEALGVKRYVTFHGKVEQAKVISLLKEAHLFCYPTAASEGFPKVVLEALASGLPVVTTRVSVLPQLIGSERGIILDEADPVALSKAVAEICSDEKKYDRMSIEAIETARKYSLENWGEFIGRRLRDSWNVKSLNGQLKQPET